MPYSAPQHRPAFSPSREQVKRRSDRVYNRTKRTGHEFYKTKAWKHFRAWFVRHNPVCVVCSENGRATPVDVVDHIIPIKQGGEPLSESNCQSLCNAHHNRKTASDRLKYG